MKIKLTKEDLVAINYSLIYVFDFDDFHTLTGFKKNELKIIFKKLVDTIFLDVFLSQDYVEVDISEKEKEMLSALLFEASTHIDDLISWNNKTINFEKISTEFDKK